MTQTAVERGYAQRTGAGNLTKKLRTMKTPLKLNWLIVMVVALTGLLPAARAFYAPATQRWLNRDPLGESGFETLRHRPPSMIGDGSNYYLFVENSPVGGIDEFGLFQVYFCIGIMKAPCDFCAFCQGLLPPFDNFSGCTTIGFFGCATMWCLTNGKPFGYPYIEL
jgi:RHS repeat-associated protein